jgi:AraC-like DNA-binding protein
VYFSGRQLAPPPLAYVVNFPRLSVPLEGRDEMELDQGGALTVISPGPGEAVFEPPNCWNRPLWTSPVKVLEILFGIKRIGISMVTHDGRDPEPRGAYKTAFSSIADSATQKILEALIEFSTHRSTSPAPGLLVQALLHCIHQRLLDPSAETYSRHRYLFENICLYIQQNFQSPITRESVAHYFRISPGMLSRVFKAEGHMSFSTYLNFVRVDRAKFMLKHYDSNVDEVAAATGFRQTSYFCRVFREKTRMTPSEFRIRSRASMIRNATGIALRADARSIQAE